MGSLWSYLGYPDESIIDSVTGLSGKQKRLIRQTKEILMVNPAGTGAAVLYEYFEKHPEYMKYFPFKDVPLDQLKTNKKFLVHCTSVMYSIASWIDSLDNPEMLMSIYSKIGLNHKKHNLPEKSFWDLRDTILACLKPMLSIETQKAYEQMLAVAMKTILSPSL